MTRRRFNSKIDPRVSYRTARVGELIRRIVAEAMERIDDPRLVLVSLTGVDVDRDLYRAVVWFTTLDKDDEAEAETAFSEHAGELRRVVAHKARLRKTPELVFRPDAVLRTAEHIEKLIANVNSGVGFDEVGESDKAG